MTQDFLRDLLPRALSTADTVLVSVLTLLLLLLLDRHLRQRSERWARHRFYRHLAMLGATLMALVAVALTLESELRNHLLQLFGILLSAAIALSSTTLLSNAMAGLMLRAQRNFRAGDYVQSGEHFGRVSERGLFFTEIQTDRRDLVTLPNATLATRALTVITSPSTLICAEVSLGYDVARTRIERLLCAAAESAGLSDPFVRILQLGDFSVLYRVSGMLADTRELLTRESALRGAVLDALHADGVEIVSPSFMSQRVFPAEQVFIPPTEDVAPPVQPTVSAETLMFEKAEAAAGIERLQDLVAAVNEKIKHLNEERSSVSDDEAVERIEAELERFETRREWLLGLIKERRS